MTGRPEILQIGPILQPFQTELEESYDLHKLFAAEDRDALLAEVGPRVRGVATTGGHGLPTDVMARLPKLEVISSFGVGVDSIDLRECAARGVRVGNTPDVLDDAVAEMAVGLMLALARRIPEGDAYVRAGRWEREGGFPLTAQITGASVGIIGLGRIGKQIASRCAGLKMKVAYHGRRRQDAVPYEYHADLEAMAAAVDWLVAITPLTPETQGIAGRRVLEALGPEGAFVNLGRGALHDEAALIELLEAGRLGGAALDVFEDEPRVPEALRRSDRVVLSPHAGSATRVTRAAMGRLTLDNLAAWFERGELVAEITA